jgi:hypothetical protein
MVFVDRGSGKVFRSRVGIKYIISCLISSGTGSDTGRGKSSIKIFGSLGKRCDTNCGMSCGVGCFKTGASNTRAASSVGYRSTSVAWTRLDGRRKGRLLKARSILNTAVGTVYMVRWDDSGVSSILPLCTSSKNTVAGEEWWLCLLLINVMTAGSTASWLSACL